MADTIEIVQGTATTIEIAGLQGPQGIQGETGATGATGPQGVPGTGIETLTTKGDLLYRDTSVAARLPIGSSGQILKVAASGIPEWGAAPASGVTSVAGRTGDVTLAKGDVGLGNVDNTSDASKPVSTATQTALNTKANSSHTHSVSDLTQSGAEIDYILTWDGAWLPTEPTVVRGIIGAAPASTTVGAGTGLTGGGDLTANRTLAVSYGTSAGTACEGNDARLSDSRAPTAHTHPTSDITSGILLHERGGLEADVSAYNGLLKIASGSTSAVTVTTAGEALLDDADASAQRTTLGAAASGSITTSGLTQSTARLIGRTSSGTGAPEEIQIGAGLSLSAGELSSTVSAGIPATLLDAKGDLIVASAADTASRLPIGATNGHALVVDSAEALGMKWAAVTASGGGATNLWIPASAFIPKTTAGCGVASRETTTNDQNFDELLFDAGSDEFADALVVMPSNYNNGTITARFYWTAASGSGDVIWAIQGRAFANDDALDTAAGTAQTVTDTLIAANDMHVSGATSAVTIGGTPAANTPIQFSIYRDANVAGDTLAVDARLLGVEIIFN